MTDCLSFDAYFAAGRHKVEFYGHESGTDAEMYATFQTYEYAWDYYTMSEFELDLEGEQNYNDYTAYQITTNNIVDFPAFSSAAQGLDADFGDAAISAWNSGS